MPKMEKPNKLAKVYQQLTRECLPNAGEMRSGSRVAAVVCSVIAGISLYTYDATAGVPSNATTRLAAAATYADSNNCTTSTTPVVLTNEKVSFTLLKPGYVTINYSSNPGSSLPVSGTSYIYAGTSIKIDGVAPAGSTSVVSLPYIYDSAQNSVTFTKSLAAGTHQATVYHYAQIRNVGNSANVCWYSRALTAFVSGSGA